MDKDVSKIVDPYVYLFLNKDLHMSTGKAAAQAVHAAMMANNLFMTEDSREEWTNAPHKTVIILEARDQVHLINIQQYLHERHIKSYHVIDEGVNEVEPHTCTALATEIIDGSDEVKRKILSAFKLYKEVAILKVRYER